MFRPSALTPLMRLIDLRWVRFRRNGVIVVVTLPGFRTVSGIPREGGSTTRSWSECMVLTTPPAIVMVWLVLLSWVKLLVPGHGVITTEVLLLVPWSLATSDIPR